MLNDEELDVLNRELRSVQDLGGNGQNLHINLTQFGSQYHGFDSQDDAVVVVTDVGIHIFPSDEPDEQEAEP